MGVWIPSFYYWISTSLRVSGLLDSDEFAGVWTPGFRRVLWVSGFLGVSCICLVFVGVSCKVWTLCQTEPRSSIEAGRGIVFVIGHSDRADWTLRDMGEKHAQRGLPLKQRLARCLA